MPRRRRRRPASELQPHGMTAGSWRTPGRLRAGSDRASGPKRRAGNAARPPDLARAGRRRERRHHAQREGALDPLRHDQPRPRLTAVTKRTTRALTWREVRHAATHFPRVGGLRRALRSRGPDRAGERRSAADLDAAHAAHSHGSAASAVAASTAAAAAASSSAASTTASAACTASGASSSRPRPAAGHARTWCRAAHDPGFRVNHGQRAPHRGGQAFGTGSQRSRDEDALLRARPSGATRHGDQLPAQEGRQGAAGRAVRRRRV